MKNQHNNDHGLKIASGGARPMKVVIDDHGYEWICDKGVNESADFAGQGCWRTDQMSFDRNF